MKNPQFTDFGLDAAQAYALASFMGWMHAVANAAVRGDIPPEVGSDIVEDAEWFTSQLMRGYKLDEGKPSETQLLPGNPVFETSTEVLANSLDEIADQMEEEQNDAV